MKVYIVADMEGITGIVRTSEVLEGEFDFDYGRKLFCDDVNAAIEGAFNGGAKEVWVNDGHWGMSSILISDLDSRAQLIRGVDTKKNLMTEGLDSSFDMMFLVGLHGKVGKNPGVMNETFWGREIHGVKINGEDIGEIALCGGHAGTFGVPVGLVTGDDEACKEAKNLLGDSPELIAVKFAIERYAARCLHPEVTKELISEAAAKAIEKKDKLSVFNFEEPVNFEIIWTSTAEAAKASMIPGVKVSNSDFRVNYFKSDTYQEGYRVLLAALILGRTATDVTYG